MNTDPIDPLGLPVDSKEDGTSDDSLGELSNDDEPEEYRYNWMRLAEMGPNVNIDPSTDLGNRDMDRNHNWIHEGRQRYSNDDLTEASNFISDASSRDQN